MKTRSEQTDRLIEERLQTLWVLALRLAIPLLAFALAVVTLKTWESLEFILLPLAIAVLLWALLDPAVDRLTNVVRLPRALAAVITVILTGSLIAGLLSWVVPEFASQAPQLTKQVTAGIDEIPDLIGSTPFGLDAVEVQEFTTDITNQLKESAGKIGAKIGTGAVTIAGGLATAATTIFLASMMLVYLLIDGKGFIRGAINLTPAEERAKWLERARRAWKALGLYVRSQVLVAAIDGIGIGLGLYLLGVPLAVPIGVFTFVVAFLPYVGAILAGLVAALIALSAKGFEGMIGAMLITALVQQIEANVLYPLLVGRSLKLHPLTVLIGVGVGGALAGLVGSFLATPVIAAGAAAAGLVSDDANDQAPKKPRKLWRRRRPGPDNNAYAKT